LRKKGDGHHLLTEDVQMVKKMHQQLHKSKFITISTPHVRNHPFNRLARQRAIQEIWLI
jgi:hypothetical protein